MSFRIKLFLAMMLLVAGVTGATLYVTQQKVRATYEKLSQDQFEAEVGYFAIQQENRLNPIKERCQELAKLPAFCDALKSGDAGSIYGVATNFLNPTNQPVQRQGRFGPRGNDTTSAAADLLRTNFPGQAGQPVQRQARPGLRVNDSVSLTAALFRTNTTFFRVLDAKGDILRGADARANGPRQANRKRWESQLAAVQDAMGNLEEQPVGYLAPERTNATIQLLEVIVTKVADPDTQQTLGALVLGIPQVGTLAASEKNISDLSHGDIQSGIWLDGQLHSRSIPETVRDEFSKRIAGDLGTNGEPKRDTLDLTLAGKPRRAFFKLLNANSPFPPAYQVSLYSMDKAIRTQNELRWQILASGCAAMLAGLILSLFIAHGLSIPLRELARGTKAVRGGDFQVRVPVHGRDELGELAASFNEMAAGLAQKERYRSLLNLVADETVARALVNGELALGGEVREASVLFCDIRGFTSLTANMPPQEVIGMLNEHMTALMRIVKEHQGVLDKFAGDLLMAIFGAPVSYENNTLNAARCALRMVQEREKLNATSQHKLKIGIGIATGNVVAGCMGSADRLNYTVLGERVNLASRLCGHAGPGQVLIDQTTLDKLGEAARAKSLPALNLKGFSGSTAAYELTEIHSRELSVGKA